MKTRRFCVALSTFVLLCLTTAAVAQQGYKKPPKEVLDILNAPVTPTISLSPTRDRRVYVSQSKREHDARQQNDER